MFQYRRIAFLCAISAMAVTAASSCADPDTFIPLSEFGGPAGVITGSVVYSGPPPCTVGGEIRGAAVLLGFEGKLLPPPEGLGTTPEALTVIQGEKLFRSIRSQLTFNADGSLWCPPAGTPTVTASAEFAVSPLNGGVYQIRGFYDLDGDFNPGFSVFNLPTAGDIGGGAVANAEAVLKGLERVRYQNMVIGEEQPDGSYAIPPTGFLLEGISVSLGLPLPLERPHFHLREVVDAFFGNTNPKEIVVPADYQLDTFSVLSPEETEASFVQLVLGAGSADDPDELQDSGETPFFFPTMPRLFLNRQDVNGDGIIDSTDSIPETTLIPAVLPLGVLTKLEDGNDLEPQEGPSVVWQGLTVRDGLLATASAPPDLAEFRDEVVLALRPAMLCIDTEDPSKDAVLVNTHKMDKQGNVLVPDQGALEATLSNQFGRPVNVQYGCLPEGRYAVNLVYDTGQAWTVPNEAGVCQPGEPSNSDGTMCGGRKRLESQAVVVVVGPPGDPAYCAQNPTPAACRHAE